MDEWKIESTTSPGGTQSIRFRDRPFRHGSVAVECHPNWPLPWTVRRQLAFGPKHPILELPWHDAKRRALARGRILA
jgi:hypothetical protein